MKKIIYLILISVISFSCSTGDNNQVFDPVNGQTLINFESTAANLEVLIDEVGSLELGITVTTISDQDRTFNIEVLEDITSADSSTFQVGTAVVPANSFLGSVTIDGIDNGVEVEPETIGLQFVEENGILTDNPILISIFQVCPVDESLFTGDYMVTGSGGLNTFGCRAIPDAVYTISSSGLARTITVDYILDCGFGTFTRDLSFNLVCDQTVFGLFDTTVGCGGAAPNIILDTPEMMGVYNTGDDSTFTLTLRDDVDEDCGPASDQLYTFVKI